MDEPFIDSSVDEPFIDSRVDERFIDSRVDELFCFLFYKTMFIDKCILVSMSHHIDNLPDFVET